RVRKLAAYKPRGQDIDHRMDDVPSVAENVDEQTTREHMYQVMGEHDVKGRLVHPALSFTAAGEEAVQADPQEAKEFFPANVLLAKPAPIVVVSILIVLAQAAAFEEVPKNLRLVRRPEVAMLGQRPGQNSCARTRRSHHKYGTRADPHACLRD